MNFDSKVKKEVFIERADSINEEFLSRVVYDTAIFYNNSPVHDGGFLLNEKNLSFALSGLQKSFTEEEQKMPIYIKQTTWNLNPIDFITVSYVEKNSVFVPIDIIIYNRTTKY